MVAAVVPLSLNLINGVGVVSLSLTISSGLVPVTNIFPLTANFSFGVEVPIPTLRLFATAKASPA